MKQYMVLVLLGQVFFRTVAQVTISTFNNVADAGTFEVGSEVTVRCEIPSYTLLMNWKINSDIIAGCALTTCSPTSDLPEHYVFSHNTDSGVFNLTINPVKSSDNGSVLLCEDENGVTENLEITVQDKTLPSSLSYSATYSVSITSPYPSSSSVTNGNGGNASTTTPNNNLTTTLGDTMFINTTHIPNDDGFENSTSMYLTIGIVAAGVLLLGGLAFIICLRKKSKRNH